MYEMTDLYSPVKRESAPQIITQRLKEAIASGDIPLGARLPAERELAERMNVSRPVVREALTRLSSYGMIASRQGGGNYVVDRFAENVFDFMGFQSELNAGNYEYFFDCRMLFECGMAEQIIVNAKAADIAQLRKINLIFAEEAQEQEFVNAEVDFHSAFLALCGNPLVVELYRMVLKFIQVSAACLLGTKDIRAEAFEAHNRIIDALEAGNESACKEAVMTHLNVSRSNLRHYFDMKAHE